MKHQEFNGITFYQTNDNDYFRHSVNGTTILMHRYVWEYYNCKIPKGYHIHHIDGDKCNNDISNLQLLKGTEHEILHGRLITDEDRKWRRNNIISKAVPKAQEWHKSDVGKEWHRQQVKYRKDNRSMRTYICMQCGKEFETFSNRSSKFCCNACKSKYRRDNNLDCIRKICAFCGKEFLTNKYQVAMFCSRECSNKSRKGN